MKKKGFTLIELLVVIAIIAILAAILFPVFAQAKLSAKKSSSLSNIKQIALGSIMYGADFDDFIPVLFAGSLLDTPGWEQGRILTWPFLTNPYRKNWGIMVNPAFGDKYGVFKFPSSTDTAADNNYRRQGRHVQYGVNYLFLSPMKYLDDWSDAFGHGRSFTQADEPAGTVFYTESQWGWRDPAGPYNRGFYGANAPGMYNVIAPDDVHWVIYYGGAHPCGGDWCQSAAIPKADRTTAFTYTAWGDGSNVAWLDGHAKYQTIGALTAGTDSATAVPVDSGGPVITDKSKYLWNLDQDYYGG